MTTKITTIHDQLYTIMTTLYPDRHELADSLLIENNSERFLDDGFAIHFGATLNTNREVCAKLWIRRQVTITLTKGVYATHLDGEKFKTAEKELFEAQLLLLNDFQDNETLDNICPKRDFISDNGIERILGAQKNFVMIESVFQIEYFENT